MKAAALAVLLFGIADPSARAQGEPAFEVASVKPAPPRAGAAALVAMDADPGMVRYSNVTLKLLISIAYRFDSRRVQGCIAKPKNGARTFWLPQKTGSG